MAKIYDNLVTEGFSGKMGRQLIFRNVKGRTIAAKQPVNKRNPKKTADQVERELRFRKAVIYAKAAIAVEATRVAYAEKAMNSPKQLSAYNVAVADYLNAPVISDFDLSGYTGTVGEKITVVAIDDFEVQRVMVEIRQSDDTVVEKGLAVQSSTGLEWEYVTQLTNASPVGSKVIVSATDLPGNVSVKEAIV